MFTTPITVVVYPKARLLQPAEHGIGLEKKPWPSISRSETEVAMMRAIKTALDPKNTLSPGNIF
jgi:FAD/FMN-containing dehydrogenase